MFNTMRTMIQSKNFTFEDMKERLKRLTAHGDLTPEQRSELERLAMKNADALHEADKAKMLADHEARIRTLEEQIAKLTGGDTGSDEGADTGETVKLKQPYINGKWYYDGNGCSEDGINYTCINSPRPASPCSWPPSVNPDRWSMDDKQPEVSA